MNSQPEDTYLSDLYDKHTVEECKHFEKLVGEQSQGGDKQQNVYQCVKELGLYFKKGERYRNKSTTIAKQIDSINERKERLEKATLKTDVLCLLCHKPMEVFSKDFHGYDKNERVLFFLKCDVCKTNRLFFENGEEYRPKPPSCEKCNSNNVENNDVREGNKITTTITCKQCDHVKVDILDLDERPSEIKENEEYLKDRDKYCLDNKQGQEYMSFKTGMEYFHEKMKEEELEKEKEHILDYSI